MPPFSDPAPLLCLLLCVSVADLRFAYVTHSSAILFSCSQDPQPCSTSSLTDCRCKNIQLSSLHWPLYHSPPVFPCRHLTVWFTSPSNVMRLLNNSEVRHLTLIHCGPPADPRGAFPLEGHFAVQKLERLTLLNMPEGPFYRCTDANRVKTTNIDQDRDHGFYFEANRYNRGKDTNMDFAADTVRDSVTVSSAQMQDIFLGRELGAAFHEQARLGVIHSSVLDWGAEVKAYTVQTHIDSDGTLPFPDLHLAKLPETSVIYVSFVYR